MCLICVFKKTIISNIFQILEATQHILSSVDVVFPIGVELVIVTVRLQGIFPYPLSESCLWYSQYLHRLSNSFTSFKRRSLFLSQLPNMSARPCANSHDLCTCVCMAAVEGDCAWDLTSSSNSSSSSDSDLLPALVPRARVVLGNIPPAQPAQNSARY